MLRSLDSILCLSKSGVKGEQWWTDARPDWEYDCDLNPARWPKQ
jgi:hypothetical protein